MVAVAAYADLVQSLDSLDDMLLQKCGWASCPC